MVLILLTNFNVVTELEMTYQLLCMKELRWAARDMASEMASHRNSLFHMVFLQMSLKRAFCCVLLCTPIFVTHKNLQI